MINFQIHTNKQSMKKNILVSLTLAVSIILSISVSAQSLNELSKKEKKAGWVLLFNGQDFDGWRQCTV